MSITNPPNYGTPDWQRGSYSAQAELASVVGGQANVTIRIPPNAETIVVVAPVGPTGTVVTMQGLQSGIDYVGVLARGQSTSSGYWTFFFDASSVTDSQAQVSFSTAPSGRWYVYADAGVHVVGDASKTGNADGYQYVIPSAPGQLSGDHPTTELQYKSGLFAAAGILLPAPGANSRYRLFHTQLIVYGGTMVPVLQDSSVLTGFIGAAPSNPGYVDYSPSGLPVSTNAAVELAVVAGAGNAIATCIYTMEAV